MDYYLAIDIGASGGRHMLGWIEDDKLQLEELYRFENKMIDVGGQLCWDIETLFAHILMGLKQCKAIGKIPKTMGIDTWAVDFVLLGQQNQRLGEAVAYRDTRTAGMDKALEKSIPFQELYAITGIQKQPFNTIYQLMALQQQHPEQLERAESLLMLPDYFHFLLTGVKKQEYTNATSTALVNAASKQWDENLITRLGLSTKLFGELSIPGTTVGSFTAEIRQEVGFDCTVVLPATHDTASAFLAVPSRGKSVYLSSGTWSLLGVENAAPITTDAARNANFTNEGGYDYRYRFLKNIMGLWMMQSIRREEAQGYSYDALEKFAEKEAAFKSRVDVNAPSFLAPKNMTEAVRQKCRESGQPVPENLGQLVRCVYYSLADSYAKAIAQLQQIAGERYDSLCVVGGGSKDTYLNQLTANASGLPVYAGPVEGTVIGNLIAQLLADNKLDSITNARNAVRQSFAIKEYIPNDKEAV